MPHAAPAPPTPVAPVLPETPVLPDAPVLPNAESDALAVAARLRLALVRLNRMLRSTVTADDGFTTTMLSALGAIETAGVLTLGELAAVEGVQPPTMTKVVTRLEERDLVVRSQDPTDRRVARLRLTDEGRRLVVERRTRRNEALAERLAVLDEKELAALAAALPALERLAGEAL